MKWNDDAGRILLELWEQGLSLSQVAAQMVARRRVLPNRRRLRDGTAALK
jgi:hypothetical protein